MGREAFMLDAGAPVFHSGRNMHLIARRLGRPGHGQPVRQEIPVFGDDVENARRHVADACISVRGLAEQTAQLGDNRRPSALSGRSTP